MDFNKFYSQESITMPLRLRDNTLTATKNNSSLIYIFCIIIRIIFGTLVFYNKMPTYITYPTSIFLISVFTFKYVRNTQNDTVMWKNYIRCIINYSLVIVFTRFNTGITNAGGLIIIIDALMGQQSRHIQNNFLN